MTNLVRDYRLLNACLVTTEMGKHPLTYQQSDYYRAIGLKPEPQIFTSGTQGINACLLGERTEGGYILAFRGTLSPGDTQDQDAICADWTQDRNYNDREWTVGDTRYGTVAEGLATAMLSLWNEAGLGAAIGRLDWRSKPEFWVTGHSKGGALAVLAHTLVRGLSQSQPALQVRWPEVVTFAAPMVAKTDFMATYMSVGLDGATTRYQNQYDIIPQVPGVNLAPIPGTDCDALNTPFVKKDGFAPVGTHVCIVFDAVRQTYVLETYQAADAAYAGSFRGDLLARLSPFGRASLIGGAHNPKGDYLQSLASDPQTAGAAVVFSATPWSAADVAGRPVGA